MQRPKLARTALVLPGGGARGAYQAGVLSRLSELVPAFEPAIITGVSAGAINAAFIANYDGPWPAACQALSALWQTLETERVFVTSTPHLMRNVLRWGLQLVGGGQVHESEPHGFLDTAPLRQLLERELAPTGVPLPGVQQKLQEGRLHALAVTATSYANGKAVTFADVTGDSASRDWMRPYREGRIATLCVEHIMASCAIPLLFPAVNVQGEWCGDGSVRQVAPLSAALHLGADRLLVVAPARPPPSSAPGNVPAPSPARVAGVVLNALMFDSIDYDVTYTQRITRLLGSGPDSEGLRPVNAMVIRPSQDLGQLAAKFEDRLPTTLRHLTRGWGTMRNNSSDILATLLFEAAYTQYLVDLGRGDVDRSSEEVLAFLS